MQTESKKIRRTAKKFNAKFIRKRCISTGEIPHTTVNTLDKGFTTLNCHNTHYPYKMATESTGKQNDNVIVWRQRQQES